MCPQQERPGPAGGTSPLARAQDPAVVLGGGGARTRRDCEAPQPGKPFAGDRDIRGLLESLESTPTDSQCSHKGARVISGTSRAADSVLIRAPVHSGAQADVPGGEHSQAAPVCPRHSLGGRGPQLPAPSRRVEVSGPCVCACACLCVRVALLRVSGSREGAQHVCP